MPRTSRRSSRGRSLQDDDDDDVVDVSMDERKPAARLSVDSDDDDDDEAQFTQFTQQAPEASQSIGKVKPFEQANLDKLGRDEREKLVTDLSRLILFKALAGEPIDKRKCAKEALGDYHVTSSAFKEAAKRLEEVFGFELRRVPKFMEDRKNFPNKYKDRLFVVNGLEDEEGGTHSKAIHSVHTDAAVGKGLLMVVLAYAFCKGEPRGDGARWITDKDLYRLLNGLDENIPGEPPAPNSRKQDKAIRHHSKSGDTPDVDALLDTFVRMDYLLKDKDDKNGAPSQSEEIGFVYSMGPRAAMEIGRRQVISFCADVLDEEPDPTMLAEIEEGDDEGELMDVEQ